ncbi:putative tricarboxylic transport membrane protein [Pseudorhodobacter antarcticus]|jgi:putative tricarboxylic transport membrane protein|uniref:Putative tricarboxylic transport membrane protein n=2 Tax=Pseudorhodobacter antarcticus TaxID=1077947 RepID=A0A1H8L7C4_9RHOB|nr:tripartite tricarboxylate transporter permease [Pseudorhodobacter antarcticus]SEO01120.1 putative tricarboxylic transport membrane protein [Pseudorhodobacter antarcticus]
MLFDAFLDSFGIFAQQPILMLMAIAAVAMGIVLGALPGVSSTMALAILLPLTFGMAPGVAMMLLLMVLVSSVFGGSISAILLNIPGTPGAIVTQFDGYPMAQQGRAGHALGHALIASTVGGVLGVIALMMIAPVIAKSAMEFRSPEFALLALFGLVLLAYTVEGAMLAGLLSGAIGLMFGMVGFDTMSGVARFDFGSAILQNGIDIIPVTIGIFGITEVLTTLSASRHGALPSVPKIGSLIPPRLEIARVWPSWLRGSTTGTLIGAIPAAGSAIAVAVAYALERRFTRGEARFGKGEPRGVAAPEAANSALTGGAMIPLVTLGIPGDSMSAILIGALIIHGLQPGPMMFVEHPDMIGTIYGSLMLATLLTFAVGVVFLRVIVQVMKLPTLVMMVLISLLCMVGAFAIRNSLADVSVMLLFGGMGYLMTLIRIPVAPLVFGLILGPLMEENLRRTLILSRGSWSVFVERPISATILALIIMVMLLPIIAHWRRRA